MSSAWLPAVPWDAPPEAALAAAVEGALEFRLRAENDRLLDARDPGEQLAHLQLPLEALEAQLLAPEALFILGDELFEYEFRAEFGGLGNALDPGSFPAAGPNPRPNLRRVHHGEFGGPDALSCAGCHSRGGLNGSGTQSQNAFFRGDGVHTRTADERNAPHVLGLGPVVALAVEMTAELQAHRDGAVERAVARQAPVKVALVTHGVEFGFVEAHADGSVDTAGVRGVDADLVVRPLGWKGHMATLQGFVEESLRVHMGVQSDRAALAVRDGREPAELHGNGNWFDLDRDANFAEVDEAQVVALAFYLAQLEVPVVRPPRDPSLLAGFARGQSLFSSVGCARCHVPDLVLLNPVLELRPRLGRLAMPTEPAPAVNVALEGETPRPERITPLPQFGYRVALFSDLKRHDMGDALATPLPHNGIPPSVFLTRPLWGLADTAPYLHDGRATSVDEAIRMHGGEAAPEADAYRALTPEERGALGVFLLSLDRAPRLFVP